MMIGDLPWLRHIRTGICLQERNITHSKKKELAILDGEKCPSQGRIFTLSEDANSCLLKRDKVSITARINLMNTFKKSFQFIVLGMT